MRPNLSYLTNLFTKGLLMSETKQLAEFVANLSFDDLPLEVVDRIKFLMMDTVGISVRAMHDSESTKSLLSANQAMGYLGGQCRVIGSHNKYTPPGAAMINGTLAHSLDFDDTHAAGSIHASAPIVPAALAAAEMVGANGKKVIAAIAAGYEVQIRLSLSLNPTEHYKRGYHPSATCGTFGAAAAAGLIFDLDADEIASAFGIAECQTSGSMRFLADGAWTKRFQVGYSGHNGLIAATLAREGFVGPMGSIEGKDGFLQSYAPSPDIARSAADLGTVWETMNIAVKPFPSCRYSHSAMGAIAAMRKEHNIFADEVESVEVGLPHTGWRIIGETDETKRKPTGAVDGQFSMPFCGAVVMREGTMGWDDYAKHLNDNDTLALTAKFSTVTDPWAESEYPNNMAGIVRIKTSRGSFEGKVSVPKGEPENFMTTSEARSKFDDLVSPYLNKSQRDELVAELLNLEKAPSVLAMLDLTCSENPELRMAGED
jgi:2-methylcitrate dehydratase PrpD